MTDPSIESLVRQAERVAERVSSWSDWRRELAASAAREAGTDREPGVSANVVRAVQEALTGQRDAEHHAG
jgi:hypothetical protein